MKTGPGSVVSAEQENIKYLLHAIKASKVLSVMVSGKFLSPFEVGESLWGGRRSRFEASGGT
jgi:hypothetical protein